MKKISNILCVLIGDETDQQAVGQAVMLAKNHQAKLILAAVVKAPEFAIPIFESKKRWPKFFRQSKKRKNSNCRPVKHKFA